MQGKKIYVACGLASIFALMGARPTIAQTVDQPTADASGLEEVVVTARRREEKLQSVPISVTAFSAKTLDEQHIQDTTDLQRLVPSLTTYSIQRDRPFFQIRGQYNAAGGPGVVTYFNEVPLLATLSAGGFPAGAGGPGQFYDLESAQVLKGPQGTLFGQNTTGGAILLYPKKPGNDYSGYAQVALGNYNDREFEAAVDVPIVPDTLLVRFSGRRAEQDGYTTDLASGKDLDNRDYWAARLSVVWRPTDDFENYFVTNSLYNHTNGTSFVLGAVKPAAAGGILASVWDRLLARPGYVEGLLAQQQVIGPRQVLGQFGEGLGNLQEGVGPLEKYWNWSITDVATWNVGDDVTIKNIFGYQQYKQLERQSPAPVPSIDYTLAAGWNTNQEEYSDELQAQGKARDGKLTWQAGGFGSFVHPIGQEEFIIDSLSSPTMSSVHPVALSRALYAQSTYDLGDVYAPLDGLRFTAGYRYTWDSRSNNTQSVVTLAHRCQIPTAIYPTCATGGNAQFQSPNWTLGLDYQLTPETLIYVRGSRGYIAGGINSSPVLPGTESFKPEYLVDMEVGVKSDWEIFGMKARTDIDAYQGYFKAIQSAASVVIPGTTSVVNVTENNGKATISGVEFEGTLVPVRDLQISATYAYTYAHYNEYSSVGFCCTIDPEFPATPQNKISVTGTYRLPFIPDALGDISASATWTYQSHAALANIADHQFGSIEPGYSLLNFRVDWDGVAGTALDASFFMNNALDKLYRVGDFALYDQLGFYSNVYGPPRMWGFQLKYHFGGPSEAPEPPVAYVPPPAVAAAPALAPKSYLVFFDFNKSDLTLQATEIVDTAAKNAGPAKVTQLTVTGHTDTVGSDAYNMRLSRRRAESVAAQLEKDGIGSSEIEIVAKGKRDLLVPTKDGVREPQNRRVQIVYGGTTS